MIPAVPALTIADRAFRINGVPARLSMANFYDAVVSDSVDEHQGNAHLLERSTITATLAAIKANGHNAVRIHTLLINQDRPGTAHPTADTWDETILEQGDFVLAECARLNLLVWAPGGDRWPSYHGGFASYADVRGQNGLAGFLANDGGVQDDWFTNHFDHLVSRVNTITGRPWREEISVFASANEVYDEAAQAFHQRFAAHVKALASGTRITADGSAASGNHPAVWALEDPNIDIVGTHLYGDRRFDIPWVRAQARIAKTYRKVYAIDEYDWREAPQPGTSQPVQTPYARANFFDFLLAETQAAGWWCVTTSQTLGHDDGYQLALADPQNDEQAQMKADLLAFNAGYTSNQSGEWTFLDYDDTFAGTGALSPDRFTTWASDGSAVAREEGQAVFRTGSTGGYQDQVTMASTASPATDLRLTFDLTRDSEEEAYFRVNLRANDMGRKTDAGTRYVAEFATWGGFSLIARTSAGDVVVMSGKQIPGWDAGVVAHLDFSLIGTTWTVYGWTGDTKPTEPLLAGRDTSILKRGYVGVTLNGGGDASTPRVWRVSNWNLTSPSAPAPLLCWDEGVAVPLAVRGLWTGSQIEPLKLRSITA